MSITLAELRSQARDRADMTNSNFVSDSELTAMINSSVAELHDIFIAGGESDYYLLSSTFSTVAGTETYALPTGFYKLRGVDVLSGSEWVSARPFNFNERNTSSFAASNVDFRYRMAGSNILLSPVPTNQVTVKLWYTPVATKLVADNDTLNDLNQFSEYVVVDAAIKMLLKEESDVSVLLATKADLRKRIENMVANRDAGQPEAISDIYAENYDWIYFTD